MEMLTHAVGWANTALNRAWLLWFGIGIVVGGIMLARDEWRLHRARPKPGEVQIYADNLIAQLGQSAFRINGDAMVAARRAKLFGHYRFQKEVSGELVRQLLGTREDLCPPVRSCDVSTTPCFPNTRTPLGSEAPDQLTL